MRPLAETYEYSNRHRINPDRDIAAHHSYRVPAYPEKGDVAGAKPEIPEGIDKSKIPTPDTPYVKIYVSKLGEVTIDGKAATIEGVRNTLAALAQKNGVVLYYREFPEEPEPHPIAVDVINLVIQNRLPIRICRNSDFSDALLPNGKLRLEE